VINDESFDDSDQLKIEEFGKQENEKEVQCFTDGEWTNFTSRYEQKLKVTYGNGKNVIEGRFSCRFSVDVPIYDPAENCRAWED
jgi:hypothetical protein